MLSSTPFLFSVGPLRDNSCLLQSSAKPGGAGCTPSAKVVGNLIWGCNIRSAWWPLTQAGSSSKTHTPSAALLPAEARRALLRTPRRGTHTPSAALLSAEARRALLRTPRRGTKRLDEAGLGLLWLRLRFLPLTMPSFCSISTCPCPLSSVPNATFCTVFADPLSLINFLLPLT